MTAVPTTRMIMAGGGTGGHLFPAIAIANRLSDLVRDRMNMEILFVGTKRGIEYRMRDRLGYPLHLINVRGIQRSLTLKNFLVPFIVVGALINAWRLLNRIRPALVIGTGGYVCWPVLKVAAWKNIPTCLQEQNSFPGVSTRQLAGRAKKIYLGFEKAREFLNSSGEIMVTGNPVRQSIADGDRNAALERFGLSKEKKTILVLGGSQGARAINNAVINSLEKNENLDSRVQVLWQTGKRDYTEVAAKTGNKVSGCALFPFAEEMNLVYAAADIVIARAGALSLAEISVCGLPAVLIPYPFAAGDHQRKNAEDYVTRGMAVMIDEKQLGQTDIILEAVALLYSDRYAKMKEAIRQDTADRKPAVDVIAEDIIEQLTLMQQMEQRVENKSLGGTE